MRKPGGETRLLLFLLFRDLLRAVTGGSLPQCRRIADTPFVTSIRSLTRRSAGSPAAVPPCPRHGGHAAALGRSSAALGLPSECSQSSQCHACAGVGARDGWLGAGGERRRVGRPSRSLRHKRGAVGKHKLPSASRAKRRRMPAGLRFEPHQRRGTDRTNVTGFTS